MKPFIACYKVFRGGELFRLSLESIREYVDGAVTVFSERPWLEDLELTENCRRPFAEFQAAHPEFPAVICEGDYRHQEEQYAAGLRAVEKIFGPDAAVLIIDTDEIWDAQCLRRLRQAIARAPQTEWFSASVHTYLKSPLYQTVLDRPAKCVVALQSPRQRMMRGRFSMVGRVRPKWLPNVWFHHFSYVRADAAEIATKFANTASQEWLTSDPGWLTDIWPRLPEGRNLHMSEGNAARWREIKIVAPGSLPPGVMGLPFVRACLADEDRRWARKLITLPPRAMCPVPTKADAAKYEIDLRARLDLTNIRFLHTRLKTTYLEALWLIYQASLVPPGGRILEIGSGWGGSTACLALGSPDGVVIDCVDPFVPYDEETHTGICRSVQEGDERAFWATLHHLGVSHRVKLIREPSERAVHHLAKWYDLAFIDGNHTQRFVAGDIDRCWSRLRTGGTLLLHDYNTRFPGVLGAVDTWEHSDVSQVFAGTSLWHQEKVA